MKMWKVTAKLKNTSGEVSSVTFFVEASDSYEAQMKAEEVFTPVASGWFSCMAKAEEHVA